jgi:predicted metal-binding membrane protein
VIPFKFNGWPETQAQGGGTGLTTAALLHRGQLAILMTLILLTVGAWALTIMQAQSMVPSPPAVESSGNVDATDAMSDMEVMDEIDPVTEPTGSDMADMAGAGWSLGGLAAFVVAWAVMMAAMMLPAVAPLLLLYRTIAAKSMPGDTAFVGTGILVAGYLLVWTAVGAGVYGLAQLGGELAGRLGAVEHQQWPSLALGTILVVAGLYQFTPLKFACLRQCQSPFGFIMGHWRNGQLGALRMGIVHGAYCLGCCWALFAVLVAAGVMSLAWMLLLTLVVFAEKVLPGGRRVSIVTGGALLLLGILVASNTIGMPWRV